MKDEMTYAEVRKAIRNAVRNGKSSAHVRIHTRLAIGIQSWLETKDYIVRLSDVGHEITRIDISWDESHENI